ncbi:MAG: MFS transporter [Chthoniobacterales bacterium]
MKPAFVSRLRTAVVEARPNELRALGFAFLFNFIVLSSYYVLRPIRDEIGAAGGVENLAWMFTGTLAVTLVANALFSWLVGRWPRRQFIPIVYRFLIFNLLVFFVLMRALPAGSQLWLGRAFFAWVSAFNLFVVTVFWAFMTDVFRNEQAKRLFGFISVGGTLGAIVGGLLTASLVHRIGTPNLLLVSALLLEGGAWCVRFFPSEFERENETGEEAAAAESPIGGSLWSGVTHVARSPYLLGICLFMLFYTVTTTFVYFQQAEITAREFAGNRAGRTAFFAQLDVWVNVLTIVVQIFFTGRLLKWLGVGMTLAVLPALSLLGFAAIGITPALGLFAFFQVLRRGMNYAVSRPAREVLFTVLRREDKYKAKSFIDTFVYRAGDQVGAWSYALLGWLGLGLTGISVVALPLATAWCALSIWLGRRQRVQAGDGAPS